MSSVTAQGVARVPTRISLWMATKAGSWAWAWRSRLMKSKRRAETANNSPSFVSRRDSASAMTFVAPDLYSIEKSKPKSLPTQ
jgi:hypothetical protein